VVLAAIHGGAIAAVLRGASPKLVALAVVTFAARASLVRVVQHGYFAHRAFEASRASQLGLALLATTANQKGALWWASAHRMLHGCSASGRDAHTDQPRTGAALGPLRRLAFFLARAGEAPRLDLVPDLAGYPELRLVERLSPLGPLALMGAAFALGGVDGLLWGYALPTAVLLHATVTFDLLAPASHAAREAFAHPLPAVDPAEQERSFPASFRTDG
jgi:stearoyl-CoA desaturase (delta-9 desaturase)